MANISSASGTITFDEEFYRQHKQLIDKAMNDIADMPHDYGIDDVDKENDDGDFWFDGSGRWTMASTFGKMLTKQWWHDGKPPVSALKLAKLLTKCHQTVDISFDDAECGCKVLYHQDAHIEADKHGKLNYCIDDTYDYEFNLPTLNNLAVIDASPIRNTAEVADWLTDYGMDVSKYPLAKVLQFIKNDKFLHGFVDDDNDCAFEKVIDKFGNYEASNN